MKIARLDAAYPAAPELGKPAGVLFTGATVNGDRPGGTRGGRGLCCAEQRGSEKLSFSGRIQTWRAGDVEGVGHDR